MEVKTFILRRLPLLVYDSPRLKSTPQARHNPDPTITNLYFDDSSFTSYMNKLERATQATSLRLRWYGKLSEQPEIAFEKKVTNFAENAEDVESRFLIKKKYVRDFLDGKYSMEKNVKKMRDGAKKEQDIRQYQESVKEIQTMIKDKALLPGTPLKFKLISPPRDVHTLGISDSRRRFCPCESG
jgi:SPX domain protein involved in polyphosphate accumulation